MAILTGDNAKSVRQTAKEVSDKAEKTLQTPQMKPLRALMTRQTTLRERRRNCEG